jgi:hypothetical protein
MTAMSTHTFSEKGFIRELGNIYRLSERILASMACNVQGVPKFHFCLSSSHLIASSNPAFYLLELPDSGAKNIEVGSCNKHGT